MIKSYELLNLLRKAPRDRRSSILWQRLGPSPLGDKRYTPQGLTWAEGYLVFANSWKNTQSRVYQLDPTTLSTVGYFDMPAEAVHTSGLAWHGKFLYAVDYISNQLYEISYDESLQSARALIHRAIATGLQGTSACCLLKTEEKTLLAVSDFRNSRRTYLMPLDKIFSGKTMLDSVALSYQNEGFSQGLEFINGFLYESENKLGKNVINKLSIKHLRATGDMRKSLVTQYAAPHWGVEDLAWDGQRLWTSDEISFSIYTGEFSNE